MAFIDHLRNFPAGGGQINKPFLGSDYLPIDPSRGDAGRLYYEVYRPANARGAIVTMSTERTTGRVLLRISIVSR